MKQIVMTRDMKPYAANHEYALPDAAADILIGDGSATLKAPAPGDIALAPDPPPAHGRPGAPPRGRYLTRGGRRG
jgi:hypothetical protein